MLSPWIGLGLLWHLLGVCATPGWQHAASHYHWSVALLLFVPALIVAVGERRWWWRTWLRTPELRWTALLLVWVCVTLAWASGTHLAERAKAPLFAMLFITGWIWWFRGGNWRSERLLFHAALGLAACALVAMIAFPWRDIVWTHRMVGFAMLDGPNLSAYAMSAAGLWLLPLAPRDRLERILKWLALSILAIFVFRTGSRGAWLALLGVALAAPAWYRTRLSPWLAAGAIAAALLFFALDTAQVLQRGLSYRPQILREALHMMEQHPWTGIGMGTRYTITVGSQSWTHSHNLFTNLAIETGLPGLVLWLGAWLSVLRSAWLKRTTPLGRAVLMLWLFASIALQVDGPSLLHSPRAEWLLTWLPLALAAGLAHRAPRLRSQAHDA